MIQTTAVRKSFALMILAAITAAMPYAGLARDSATAARTDSSTKQTAEADKLPPFKLGVLISQTGVGSEMCKELQNGMDLYLNEIKHKMGGHKVDLFMENDGSSKDLAIEKAVKLLDKDKVHILSGLALSNIALALLPIINKHQTPTVVTVSAADDLTQRKHSPWIIRTAVSASQPSYPFGEWVYKKLKYKRIATFGLDYANSWETIGAFQKSYEDAGGKVVQKIWVPLGFRDFSDSIKKIRPDADALFISSIQGSAEIILQQLKENGIKLPLVGGSGTFDENVIATVGDLTLGATSTRVYCSTLATAANRKFVAAYTARYNGSEPSAIAEYGYTAMMWINKALENYKGDLNNKEQLMEALRKVELTDAPRGPMKLDNLGNPIENIYVRKVEKVGGKYQNNVVQTFPKVSQFWKYKEAEILKQPTFSKDFPGCKYCE